MKLLIKARTKDDIVNRDKDLIKNIFIDNQVYINYLHMAGFSEGVINKSLSTGIGKFIKNNN